MSARPVHFVKRRTGQLVTTACGWHFFDAAGRSTEDPEEVTCGNCRARPLYRDALKRALAAGPRSLRPVQPRGEDAR